MPLPKRDFEPDLCVVFEKVDCLYVHFVELTSIITFYCNGPAVPVKLHRLVIDVDSTPIDVFESSVRLANSP